MAEEKGRWLEIHDDEVTAVVLEAKIDGRLQKRRAEKEVKSVRFPRFGEKSPLPEFRDDRLFNLFWHLRALNEQPPPETTAVLARSPAGQLPVLGRLWQTIRREAHNLVLFYVNRSLRYTTRTQRDVTAVLNELTRQVQAQQTEIEQLKAELQALAAEDSSR